MGPLSEQNSIGEVRHRCASMVSASQRFFLTPIGIVKIPASVGLTPRERPVLPTAPRNALMARNIPHCGVGVLIVPVMI